VSTNAPQQDSPNSPHPLGDPRKGPEAYLDFQERQNLARMLSYPEDLPPKFKAWLLDFIAVNANGIPASAITGLERASVSARLTRATDQTGLSGGVRTNVVWTVAAWDPASMWDGTSKVIITQPGKYLVTLQIEWGGTAGQQEIWKNNVTREGATVCVLDMAKGDFIEAKVLAAGSGIPIHAEANTSPVLTVTRVSA
jgi:hypothetical protein